MKSNKQVYSSWYRATGDEKENYDKIYESCIRHSSRIQLFAFSQNNLGDTPVSERDEDNVRSEYTSVVNKIKSANDLSTETVQYLKECKPLFMQKLVTQLKKDGYSVPQNYLVGQIVNNSTDEADLLSRISKNLKSNEIDNFISPAGHVGTKENPCFGIPLRLNDDCCNDIDISVVGESVEEL